MVARLHCSTVSWLHGLTVLRFVFIDSWLHGSCVHGGTIPLFDPPVYAVWFHSLTQFNSSLLHISFKRFLNFTIACHAVARLYGLIHSCTVARSQFHSFFMVTRFDGCTIVLRFHSFTFFVSRCTVCGSTVSMLHVPRFGRFAVRFDRYMVDSFADTRVPCCFRSTVMRFLCYWRFPGFVVHGCTITVWRSRFDGFKVFMVSRINGFTVSRFTCTVLQFHFCASRGCTVLRFHGCTCGCTVSRVLIPVPFLLLVPFPLCSSLWETNA